MPKKPPPADQQKTLAAFIDDTQEEADVQLVDRSTLDNFATCPFMGRTILDGLVPAVGEAAAIGDQVHDAIGKAIGEYIELKGHMSRGELSESIKDHLQGSRPDLQTQSIQACNWAAFKIAGTIASISHENILRYDGGEEFQSGQLSLDMEIGDTTYRVTSELDLLLSGISPDLVEEHDWKSGWKVWTEDDVYTSLQFQLHALLLLETYPEIEAADIRVWNLRKMTPTARVRFKREMAGQIRARVRAALGEYHLWRGGIHRDQVPVWPNVEKCRICDAVAHCPAASRWTQEVRADPAGYLKAYVAQVEKVTKMRKELEEYRDATGEEIYDPETGTYGGREKPHTQKRPFAVYTVKVKGGK